MSNKTNSTYLPNGSSVKDRKLRQGPQYSSVIDENENLLGSSADYGPSATNSVKQTRFSNANTNDSGVNDMEMGLSNKESDRFLDNDNNESGMAAGNYGVTSTSFSRSSNGFSRGSNPGSLRRTVSKRKIGKTLDSEFTKDLEAQGKLLTREDFVEERRMLSEINRLGSGNFGEVYKCKLKNGNTVAVKRLKKYDPTTAKELIKETQVLLEVNEEFIEQKQESSVLEIYGYYRPTAAAMDKNKRKEDGYVNLDNFFNKPCLVTAFYENGTLEQYLLKKHRNSEEVDFSRLCEWSRDICNAVHFLAVTNIVHRDIAARNVMLDENLSPKLIDFGLARQGTDASASENSTLKAVYQRTTDRDLPLAWLAIE